MIPWSSDPSNNVADKAVHKELGDSLVRAATTVSSLEAKHDSGNITKTRSKAIPNESSSQRTNSGGVPWAMKNHMGILLLKLGLRMYLKHTNDSSAARGTAKRGGFMDIDADEEITLVSVQNVDEEMFDVNVLDGEDKGLLANMEGYKLNNLKLKDFDSIQEMFDRAFKRVNTSEDFRTKLVEGKEKRGGTELIQETTKKQ
ncbi:hypothetical protein Tco_1124507 [Tanacetum coccineum]|uniref:Uncharacterized protein n=1 Tax=Tanacetum coccineum TaxID=301880 RepID=A0ABQ5J6B7_9ASTR